MRLTAAQQLVTAKRRLSRRFGARFNVIVTKVIMEQRLCVYAKYLEIRKLLLFLLVLR